MRKLSRNREKRTSLLRNLAISLVKHGVIQTTLIKAKELRSFVEPLITQGKENTLHSRRELLRKLYNNNEAATAILTNYGVAAKNRNGGYTRIIKNGRRTDGSQVAIIEIIDDLNRKD